MTTKFKIHIAGRGPCNCFSLRDLLVNLNFAIREGLKILSVERVTVKREAA